MKIPINDYCDIDGKYLSSRQNKIIMSDRYIETDKMGDLISDDYRLLQVISRFGLSMGFGEKTIKEICSENKVDCQTFLAVVNLTKQGDKCAPYWVDRLSVPSLTEYLRQAHSYYLDFLLPNIRKELLEAVDCSKRNEVAFLILKFFDEYVDEVQNHMEHENHEVFAYVDELIAHRRKDPVSIEMTLLHRNPIEQRLSELKSIIIKYCNVKCNNNLLNRALFDIFLCEEDLHTHYRMEELLFIPAIKLFEERVQDELEQGIGEENSDDDSDILSEREKEVIVLVVKGMTNKEIADKLFISYTTVTTHRRNIARKLNIHSPAGLTIYAIVNELVNIKDIKQ
jgi:regulator of cell morphogenesis and NO signaling